MNDGMVYGKFHRFMYRAISAYVEANDPDEWLDCPTCKLKPLIWRFDNGDSTACGCGNSDYDHRSVHAESIMSYVKRNNGSALGYGHDDLRINWNHWVRTGEEKFVHASNRIDGRW